MNLEYFKFFYLNNLLIDKNNYLFSERVFYWY